MATAFGALAILFFLYNYIIFAFINTLLENSKMTVLSRLLVSAVNTAAAFYFIWFLGSESWVAYLIIAALFFAEFYLFHKDKVVCCLFCMLACLIHIMTMRSVSVATFAVLNNRSLYGVVSNPSLLIWSTAATFGVLCPLVFVVRKLVPAKNVKIINQHREQLWFMVAWLIIFCSYLLINSKFYGAANPNPVLIQNQIIAPITILIGVYIVLFFSFKTSVLLGYKEKSQELLLEFERTENYLKTVDKDVLSVIDVNFSKNEVLSGYEGYLPLLDNDTHSFSELMQTIAPKLVHPNDLFEFLKYNHAETLVNAFRQGQTEIFFDYRRKMSDGDYAWMQMLLTLMEDEKTGDIKGFAQIKNIDTLKKQQLELQYKAERDSLTSLYNKGMTEKLIREHLSQSNPHARTGTFFILDIDNFKAVNDQLGHLYGDIVLSEIAEKLRYIFREDDIIGRIGGDEFAIFAKGLTEKTLIILKASEICKATHHIHKNAQGVPLEISSSVGIAVAPQDGDRFSALYQNADIALYTSKGRGKNTYSFYDGSAFAGYESQRTEPDTQEGHEQKSFKENRIEYIFKILYSSPHPIAAIHSAIELLTGHFHFDRGYIFEVSKDGQTVSNTFEWCEEGIPSAIDNLQNVPLSLISMAVEHFKKSGSFILKSLHDLPPSNSPILEHQGIQSMFQFAIFDADILLGFVGFDNCHGEGIHTDNEVDELSTICNILATFFVKQQAIESAEKNLKALNTIMNRLSSYNYVIKKDTYELLFMNHGTEALAQEVQVGDLCYAIFREKDTPCSDCPLQFLSDDEEAQSSVEIYNDKFKVWSEVTASYIKWTHGEDACLISCMDITKYKK